MIWIQFIICSSLIVFAGIKLTKYADILSDELHLGKVWIGVVLLGLVTSLPEAVASLTSVISLQANDLAAGNMLGSNNLNILLICVMDLVYRNGSVSNVIPYSLAQLTPAVWSIILTWIVIGEIMLGSIFTLPTIGTMSFGSLVIAGLYFYGIKSLAYGQGDNESDDVEDSSDCNNISLKSIFIKLFVCAAIVVVSAAWLARVADVIAEATGLGETFVGSILLAFVTSLPEMVVTISALKMGAMDMAIGNIFGSNMNNIFILSFCDIFYVKGALLSAVSSLHLMTGFLSILLAFIALIGIKNKNKKCLFGIGWDSLMLIFVYLLGMSILYYIR